MNKLRALCEKWERLQREDNRVNMAACAAELEAILPDVERLVEALREVLEYNKTQRRIPLGLYSKVQSAFALFDQPVAPKETK